MHTLKYIEPDEGCRYNCYSEVVYGQTVFLQLL